MIRIVLLSVLVAAAGPAAGGELPEGFVHLGDLAPDVVQDMRYAGADNFTGRPVPGYRRGACILARPAAEALARVQARAAADGLRLRVFDCYRPKRAVAAFMAWADDPAAADETSPFHPRIARGRVVAEGYVARASSHSKGIAVDVTLEAAGPDGGAGDGGRDPCAPPGPPLVDMGTGFDCFDARAATASRAVGAKARGNRRRLAALMAAEGFAGYPREWWHFSLPSEGFGQARDFPVE